MACHAQCDTSISGVKMVIARLLVPILLQILTNVQGACIPLSQCSVANKYIDQRRDDPETVKILRSAHCGFGDNGPKVHCDRIPDFEAAPDGCVPFLKCPEAVELSQTGIGDPQVAQKLRDAACGNSQRLDMVMCNMLLPKPHLRNVNIELPAQCGISAPVSLIYGASSTELDEFPWLALFRYRNHTGHLAYRCHGTLINNRYVVTAAHCVQLSPKDRRKLGTIQTIILGEYDVNNSTDCLSDDDCNLPVQEFVPESIHVHPDFGNGPGSDIALIRLNRKVTFTDYVKPICLPVTPLNLNNAEPLWVAGWGRTENQTMSNVKLQAKIFHWSRDECGNRIVANLHETQLCAGSDNGADTCKGDSGGPLMANRPYKGGRRIFLAGVVSYGPKCGDKAAFYTNVSMFTEWIKKTMKT